MHDIRASAGAQSGYIGGVAAGRRDVEVRLVSPASIEGVVENFDVVPDVAVTNLNTGHRYRVTAANNAFRVQSLPAGTYVVRASSTSGVVEKEVDATPGAITKVTLRSRGFGTIEGTLVDAAQIPLTNHA